MTVMSAIAIDDPTRGGRRYLAEDWRRFDATDLHDHDVLVTGRTPDFAITPRRVQQRLLGAGRASGSEDVVGRADPLAQQRAGVGRIDDVLDEDDSGVSEGDRTAPVLARSRRGCARRPARPGPACACRRPRAHPRRQRSPVTDARRSGGVPVVWAVGRAGDAEHRRTSTLAHGTRALVQPPRWPARRAGSPPDRSAAHR